ncbi:alpha/beta hydrolase family protein [Streptomyces sp. NPDC051567]|uniref:alpha/beta hydrolase family protein n=1 Tax=Streptomyces sp. NPDC051567 TaxID=3365660 RepID=UPI0037A0BCD4
MITRRSALTITAAGLGLHTFPTTTAAAATTAATARPGATAESGGAAGPALPRPTGRHPVGTRSFPLTDASRTDPFAPHPGPRELMVQLWYPLGPDPYGTRTAPYTDAETGAAVESASGFAPGVLATVRAHARRGGPPAAGTRTAVLLSHGRGSSRVLTSGLAEELASHGHLVAAVDHTYDASAVRFPDGRLLLGALPPAPDDWDAQDRLETAVRAADLRTLADALTRRHRPAAGVAVTRIGLLGHSMGGAAAAEAIRLDRRFAAGLDLDGGLFGTTAADTGLDRPFLLLTSSPDHDTWARWRANHRHWGRHLHLTGGGHLSATDVPALAGAARLRELWPEALLREHLGTLAPDRAATVTRAVTTAFFDRFLLGRERPLLDGPSPRYPEIEFRWTHRA